MLGNTRCDLHPAGYPEVIRVGGLEFPLASISPADTLQGEANASFQCRDRKEVQSTESDTQLSRTVFRDTAWAVAKQ